MPNLVFLGILSEDFISYESMEPFYCAIISVFIGFFVMIFGMCRYIFVGFHMELVLKCAKKKFFLSDNWTEVSLNAIFCFCFTFKEAYYHVRVKLCEAVRF